jgi:hypothetical protein
MTTVKLNHEGVDVVELKASVVNSSEIQFTAKHNLFNADLKYIFGVTDLNVDCSNLPIFPSTLNDTLFTIKRRVLDNNFELTDVAFVGVVQRFQILPVGKRYFDTASFLSDVSATANTFSTQQDLAGVAAPTVIAAQYYANLQHGPFKYLKIGFDAGGRITIKGVSGFWDNFVIQFSDFAIKLFQLQDVVGGAVG